MSKAMLIYIVISQIMRIWSEKEKEKCADYYLRGRVY